MNQALRFFAPVVLLATGAYVGWVNTGHERRIVFPLLDRLTSDVNTQGQITVALLFALSLGAALLAFRRDRPE